LAEKRRPRLIPPPPERQYRRPGVPLVVSVALHVVVGAIIVALLLAPKPTAQWLHSVTHGARPTAEHIQFAAVPQAGNQTTAGKSGGNGIPKSKVKETPRTLVAPTTVPNGIPEAPAPTAPEPDAGGTGAVIGNGGATEGVTPTYHDSRVWVAPGSATAARSGSQQIDSMLSTHIKRLNDSAAMTAQRAPGDWTFHSKDGEAWGMDQKFIRLGPVSIPDAVLAVLPINHLGENPEMGQRERQLNAMRQDIMEGAQRQLNEDDFHRAVKEVRERKEREHEELLRLQQIAKPKPLPPPPTVSSDQNNGSVYSAPPPQPEVQ
jgi:hypothetical protein